jgi:hypothetical protein
MNDHNFKNGYTRHYYPSTSLLVTTRSLVCLQKTSNSKSPLLISSILKTHCAWYVSECTFNLLNIHTLSEVYRFNHNTPTYYSFCVILYGCVCFLSKGTPPVVSTDYYLCVPFSSAYLEHLSWHILNQSWIAKATKHLSVSDYSK